MLYPFQPNYTKGQVVTPAAASAAATIGGASARQVCLTNLGANVCYVRIGGAGGASVAAATTADYPVHAGAQVIVTKQEGDDTLNYISAAGTTLHIIPGLGL